jgi:hypothetical protein
MLYQLSYSRMTCPHSSFLCDIQLVIRRTADYQLSYSRLERRRVQK